MGAIGFPSPLIKYGYLGGNPRVKFWGRSIDTFEAAMTMLFNGDRVINHIDCISGRSFSLCREIGNMLYSCTLSDKDAVNNLNKYLGNVLQVVSPAGLSKPFVLRVRNDLGVPTIFRKYYPEGHYVYCTRKESKLIVHDPDGFPRIAFDAERFDWDGQSAIVTTGDMLVTDINFIPLIDEMLAVNRDAKINNSAVNRIFLQYATRNYIRQTGKVIVLIKEIKEFSKTNEVAFMDMFSDMIAAETKTVRSLLFIDEKIWTLIEEIWYSKV